MNEEQIEHIRTYLRQNNQAIVAPQKLARFQQGDTTLYLAVRTPENMKYGAITSLPLIQRYFQTFHQETPDETQVKHVVPVLCAIPQPNFSFLASACNLVNVEDITFFLAQPAKLAFDYANTCNLAREEAKKLVLFLSEQKSKLEELARQNV